MIGTPGGITGACLIKGHGWNTAMAVRVDHGCALTLQPSPR
jgi:hypothetical protein